MYIRKDFIFVQQCYHSSFYVIDKNSEIYKKRMCNFKRSFIQCTCISEQSKINRFTYIYIILVLYTYYIILNIFEKIYLLYTLIFSFKLHKII